MSVVILHPDPSRLAYLRQLLPEVDVQKSLVPSIVPKLVIRWGVSDVADPTGAVVINRAQSMALVSRATEVWRQSMLRLATGTSFRRYRIYLFDLLPVLVYRQEIGSRTIVEVNPEGSKEIRDAIALAVRALHVLGLDFAVVEIHRSSQGRLGVRTVDVAPKMTKRLANALVSHVRQRLREVDLRQTMVVFQKANPAYLDKVVSIGADPEFMLRDSTTMTMIMASKFFPREGSVGCDSLFIRGRESGYPLAELRPAPSYSPLQLLTNIRIAMELALRLAPFHNVEWCAGSLPFGKFPIGGHIHFAGVVMSGQLLRALDTYLSVPLLMIENIRTAIVRRAKFGYLGDYRLKEHGGFEYRTPASWLVAPDIALATLCLAKVVVSEYHLLKRDVFSQAEARTAFSAGDRKYFTGVFSHLWQDLKATSTYRLYESELQNLEDKISVGWTWSERADIRRAWGLRVPRTRFFRN